MTFTAILVTGRNMGDEVELLERVLSGMLRGDAADEDDDGECATWCGGDAGEQIGRARPLVTRQTPGVPVTRASPSAMNADPCSWRQLMYSTALSS